MNNSLNTYTPQNVPYTVGMNGQSSCGDSSAPMAMLGYQCDPVNHCTAVSQFTYEPGKGSFYFSPGQCTQACGGIETGTYIPKKVFD